MSTSKNFTTTYIGQNLKSSMEISMELKVKTVVQCFSFPKCLSSNDKWHGQLFPFSFSLFDD